ncbi:MAG: TylF/MycF family methyltransferase [Actinomycetota bacterium]|nr:TylF/MycF family methyltransferase [Actinomycetota bacterium]
MRRALVRAGIAAAMALRLNRLARWLVAHLPRRFAVRFEDRVYALNAAGGRTGSHVAQRELEAIYRAGLARLDSSPGDCLEFGVYTGTTLTCLYRALEGLGLDGVRIFGFDSFDGMPHVAGEEAASHSRAGMFRAGLDEATESLSRNGVDMDRVTLVKGWFDDTLTQATRRRLGIERLAVALLDCDIYSSAKAALDFCAPLIQDRAVLVFDDWVHGGADAGEQRAFRELLAEHPGLRAEEIGSYPAAGHPDGGRAFLVSRDGHR